MKTSFNPADYCFNWTDGWYEWDRQAAHKAAQKARNEMAKRAKANVPGLTVTKSSTPGQLITRGGIGSGHPQIEMFVTVYTLNVR